MNMKKAIAGCTLAIMLTLALSACGSSSTTMNANISEPSEATAQLVIHAKNWEFDQAEYHVKAGEAVKIAVESESGFHGVKIKDTSFSIKSNESKILSFDKAGTYEIFCNIACGTGHTRMKAEIIVE
ncbi:cytochrome c oxidase subunit 2 [Paenibacillus cellulosilyticus]|uniref:Cytochrome c oxidase subunit 2 n=1 Tax=Paenibacillus cellulosilyticus TaxID=375489 RepID=A0A2V2Z1J7_9BACL|nr:cupredoxin domain-containing protein [Paenibacillus cellulosilyticus]PWW07421.1 cytochrome c oxidase subunit 2 [Paenibacillus cellulosilyticus]QKS44415.1 cupredoxin domain-containing protein [Paenibacillus cellulosilyticus]